MYFVAANTTDLKIKILTAWFTDTNQKQIY